MRALGRFTVHPVLPEPLEDLRALAMNLRWTWDYPTQALFRTLDPDLWLRSGRDPLVMLRETAQERLDALAGDDEFLGQLGAARLDLDRYLSEPRWYQQLVGAPRQVAYFSPEFGLSEVLPQYSGGLGILAGDHLKAGSDLGVPLVGVGLFYRHGYFSQRLSADHLQLEHYPVLDPAALPLELLRDGDGAPALVRVRFPGAEAYAQIWVARVGRVPLLLLDSDVEHNAPAERDVTDELYGGNAEHRLRQEIMLGIGGMRALDAFGAAPEVFHTNEGHAGFLGLERARRLLAEDGLDLEATAEIVRRGTVFTTHTPVPAGIDRFLHELVGRYLGPDGEDIGVGVEQVLALGAEPGGDESVFNMAVMGLRLAQRANGVSRLHGEVSRRMFQPLWPGLQPEEVPIGHVTNGVHAATWVTREWLELFERHLGPQHVPAGTPRAWDAIRGVPDEELWQARVAGRAQLVREARERLMQDAGAHGSRAGRWAEQAFDPDILTIGFARRVPSYKRLTLLLRERERLVRLLLDPTRPIQLIVAGKAHPADAAGKQLIRDFADFAAEPAIRHRVAFLPDYGMAMGRRLVSGADVWLNNPLRPFEACGTSGMKAALNGALNLSVRDGWWDELYDGDNGWAIPSADGSEIDPERRDELEAGWLLDLLEQEVVPRFYDREDGLPRRWIAMIKHSIATVGPAVLADRMVRDYVERLYVPAAGAAAAARDEGFSAARELAAWKATARAAWPVVRVRSVETGGPDYVVGERLLVRADVHLGPLAPEDVEVQVVYGLTGDEDDLTGERIAPLKAVGEVDGAWRYEGEVPLMAAGAYGYAVRVVAQHEGLLAPAEPGLVTWAGEG